MQCVAEMQGHERRIVGDALLAERGLGIGRQLPQTMALPDPGLNKTGEFEGRKAKQCEGQGRKGLCPNGSDGSNDGLVEMAMNTAR